MIILNKAKLDKFLKDIEKSTGHSVSEDKAIALSEIFMAMDAIATEERSLTKTLAEIKKEMYKLHAEIENSEDAEKNEEILADFDARFDSARKSLQSLRNDLLVKVVSSLPQPE